MLFRSAAAAAEASTVATEYVQNAKASRTNRARDCCSGRRLVATPQRKSSRAVSTMVEYGAWLAPPVATKAMAVWPCWFERCNTAYCTSSATRDTNTDKSAFNCFESVSTSMYGTQVASKQAMRTVCGRVCCAASIRGVLPAPSPLSTTSAHVAGLSLMTVATSSSYRSELEHAM